jgi:glycosyltransferase involved in cell wall biosynthesis
MDSVSAIPRVPSALECHVKILQLISSEGKYGAETMLLCLVKSLALLGHESVIGVFRNSHCPHTEIAEAAKLEGLKVEIISCDGKVDRSAMEAIRHILRIHSIDLVHTHGYKANFYGYLAARGEGVPLVATYHLDWPDRGLALRLYHLLDRLVVRRFGRIAAVSEAVARSLRRSGVPSARIATIDNGIDLFPFTQARPTLRKEMPQRPKMLIGLVGRLTPQKGCEYFLQAAQKVLVGFPEALFVLVGEGPDRMKLEALAQELKIRDRVIFAGHREDMPGVYSSLDVLVLPSINEGLPMTLIEAMAAARPVVATPVGAVPKLVIPEQTGLLVNLRHPENLAAAIGRFISDPDLRRRLGANGQAWVMRRFSAEAMARKYAEIYQDTAAEHMRGSLFRATAAPQRARPAGERSRR